MCMCGCAQTLHVFSALTCAVGQRNTVAMEIDLLFSSQQRQKICFEEFYDKFMTMFE